MAMIRAKGLIFVNDFFQASQNGPLLVLGISFSKIFRFFVTARSPSKNALESAISDIYFNFDSLTKCQNTKCQTMTLSMKYLSKYEMSNYEMS